MEKRIEQESTINIKDIKSLTKLINNFDSKDLSSDDFILNINYESNSLYINELDHLIRLIISRYFTSSIFEISIYICSSKNMKEIHNILFQKDTDTNILSMKDKCINGVGEIFISLSYIKQQYMNRIKYENFSCLSYINFLMYLSHHIIHSLLHIMNFNHKTSIDKQNMFKIEKSIIRDLFVILYLEK